MTMISTASLHAYTTLAQFVVQKHHCGLAPDKQSYQQSQEANRLQVGAGQLLQKNNRFLLFFFVLFRVEHFLGGGEAVLVFCVVFHGLLLLLNLSHSREEHCCCLVARSKIT